MCTRTSADVPATFDEFAARYEDYITYCLKIVSRFRLKPDQLEDIRQLVYLRIWEKGYLDRWRTLLEVRPLSLSTLIWTLTRSTYQNWCTHRARRALSGAISIFDPRDRDVRRRRGGGMAPPGTVAYEPTDAAFEARMLARDELHRLAQYVRMTGHGARRARTLKLLFEGYQIPEIAAMTRSKHKSRVIQDRWALKAALRQLRRAG